MEIQLTNISGPALCLFFGALRSTTNPPSVPLPRSRADKTKPPMHLSRATCPPAFSSFLQVWASSVPTIQALPSQHQHDLARVICDLKPLSQPAHAGIARIAADIRAVAIEISQRRTFQERYQTDLQVALDTGIRRGTRQGHSATAQFMPPPMYNEKDSSSTGSRTPEPEPEPDLESDTPQAGSSLQRSSTLAQTESIITLIRETLFASLADVVSSTPTLRRALDTDPPRAYFACVALAILNVATTSLTPDGGVRGVLGRNLTLEECPESLRPLMRELGAIGQEAQHCATEDNEDAIRLAARGKRIPEPRLDRLRKMLEGGVGYNEHERSPSAEEDDSRSVEGRAVQFSNRVNRLALTFTSLPAFQSYAKEVFEVLRALG